MKRLLTSLGAAVRTILPASYPAPASYDVSLSPGGLIQAGLTGTSCAFYNLANLPYTVTVVGKDAGGNAIVNGSASADLTSANSASPAITLNYISVGAGTGGIALSFNAAYAGPATSVSLTLIDPSGATSTPSAAGTYPNFSYTNPSAAVGTYKVFAVFTDSANRIKAVVGQSLLVVQNVTTAATIAPAAVDYSASYTAVSSVSGTPTAQNILVGGACSLSASLGSASNQAVVWKSSDTSVATVTQNGVATGVGIGTATISATSIDDTTKSGSGTVTVGMRTVTFNLNGASGTAPAAVTQWTGSSYTVPLQGAMTYANYTFTGWNSLADGSGSSYAPGASQTVGAENQTLYAQWAITISTFVQCTTAGIGSSTLSGIAASGSSLYLATGGGLSISTDGGVSWTNKTSGNGLGNSNIWSVAASGSTVVAGTNTGGVSVSANNGSTWTTGLAGSSCNAATVYGTTIYAGMQNLGLEASANGGSSWTQLFATPTYCSGIAVSGSTIYAATYQGLNVSTNSGSSWTLWTTSNGLPTNDVYCVALRGTKLYAGTVGGGLAVSSDNGATWTTYTTSNGLANNTIWGICISGSAIYLATSGGISVSTNDCSTWTTVLSYYATGVSVLGANVYAATGSGDYVWKSQP